MRQIVLDTETTGLEPKEGHRIIEVACVELVARRSTGETLHHYLNPERAIDAGAQRVHGLTDEQLKHAPGFADIVDGFLEFIRDSEVLIHNAPFDESFLNAELARLDRGKLSEYCQVSDTLTMARKKHPGRRNSLDALCQRYLIDTSQREVHGALLDAKLLTQVYLAMTGGQISMAFSRTVPAVQNREGGGAGHVSGALSLPVIHATDEERAAHQAVLERMQQENGCELHTGAEGDASG